MERGRREADSLSPSQYEVANPLPENFSEYSTDGIPVTNKRYRAFPQDGLGFRVYNSWFQHRREKEMKNDPRFVLQRPTFAPIRPHHRFAN